MLPSPEPSAGGFVGLLDADDRDALLGLGRRRRFPRGAPIIIQGDDGDTVYVVDAGRVKVVVTTPDGDEMVLAVDGPGDLLGVFEAIDRAAGPRMAGNVALEPVECRALTGEEFRAFLDAHPRVAVVLLRWIIHRLRIADRRRVDAYALDSVHRLAELLAEIVGDDPADGAVPVDIDLPLTQQEVASLIGASRDSVVRALGSLRARGLVSTDRRRIRILDVEGLRRYAAAERGED